MCLIFQVFLFRKIGQLSSSEESLFTYRGGQTYLDYAHPNHVPSFVDEVVAAATPDILEACGTNQECIFDATETGNINVGLQTMMTQQNNINDQTQSSKPVQLRVLNPQYIHDIRYVLLMQ